MTGINPNLSSYLNRANSTSGNESPTSATSLGKQNLESHFPKNVSTSQETYSRTIVIELDGKRYALTGKPTYTQNAQGTFDLTDIKYSYKEIGPNEDVAYAGNDENVVWYGGNPSSPTQHDHDNHLGLSLAERNKAHNAIKNTQPNIIATFRKDLGLK